MEQKYSYSIVIRTLGNTGDKYCQMLDCINSLSIKPEEVIVVIPYGYELDYTLGYERVVRSEKGMVTQRAVGIQEAKSDYVLVVDDDLRFEANFVERLFESLTNNRLDCVLSFQDEALPSTTETPARGRSRLRGKLMALRRVFTGQHIVTYKKQSEWFDKVTVCAGHKTYESNPLGLCNCGCFQCFLPRRRWLKKSILKMMFGLNRERYQSMPPMTIWSSSIRCI